MLLEVALFERRDAPFLRFFVEKSETVRLYEANQVLADRHRYDFLHTSPHDAELEINWTPGAHSGDPIEVEVMEGEPVEQISRETWEQGSYDGQEAVAFRYEFRMGPSVVLSVSMATRGEVAEGKPAGAWEEMLSRIDRLSASQIVASLSQLTAEQVLQLATSHDLAPEVLDLLAASGWALAMARVAVNPQASERTLARLSYSHPVLVAQNPALELLSLTGSLKDFSPPVLESVARRGWETL